MALSSSPGSDNIMARGGSTGHSNGLGPGDGMALDTNMAQAWLSPWSQVAVKATQIGKAPVAMLYLIPTWPQVVAQTSGIVMVLNSIVSHRHQHRPCSWATD